MDCSTCDRQQIYHVNDEEMKIVMQKECDETHSWNMECSLDFKQKHKSRSDTCISIAVKSAVSSLTKAIHLLQLTLKTGNKMTYYFKFIRILW